MRTKGKWSILKRVAAYTPCSGRCKLYLKEKLSILKSDKKDLLKTHAEFFAKCRHMDKFSARSYMRAQQPGSRVGKPSMRSRKQTKR